MAMPRGVVLQGDVIEEEEILESWKERFRRAIAESNSPKELLNVFLPLVNFHLKNFIEREKSR